MNKNNKLEKFRQRKAQEFFTQELPEDDADILCENEEKPLASEIIADQSAEIEKLKAELQDKQENLDICAGLADRYMYRQRIVECTLKLKDEKLLKCAYTYMKKLTEGEE